MYIDVPTDDISIETLIIFYFTMHYVDMPIYILREIEWKKNILFNIDDIHIHIYNNNNLN